MEPPSHHHRMSCEISWLLAHQRCVRQLRKFQARRAGLRSNFRLQDLRLSGVTLPHNCTTHETVKYTSDQSQGLGRFVSVSYIPCGTSTPDRSTLSSTGGLTLLRDERSHLRAGFTLRCFQRFSVPNVATQLYPWRDNWYTIGSSTPVLSY